MKKILLLMSVVLLACIGGYSQAPGIFNYQGVARNSVGNVLVNQSINLRLTIHDGSAGGAVVYQESRAAVTNPFGLFNVQVGSAGGTNVTGTIAGVPWGIGNKYLQVEIDPSGGTTFINIGTAQIASVPYSFYSAVTSDLVLPYNKTQADAGTLFKITNSGTGGSLEGLTNSTLANAFGIKGTVTSTAPGGFSTGVFGLNNGTGGLGIGVMGQQNGTGWGVYGVTPGGRGVYGSTTTGVGVYGDASSGTGVFGTSSTSNAGVFTITNAANNTDALQASTNGGPVSWAIRATSTGSQGAGIFQYNNGAGGASALRVLTNGTGFAANISSSNATPKALLTNGGVQLTGINEANNRILASDAVGNALWKDPSAIGVVTGSGTLNFVPKWTPTGTNLGNSIMFDNGTLVGVGTVTPFNTKLHVASDGNGANGFAGTRYTTPTSAATFGGLYVGLNFATGAQDVYIGTNETADMGFYTSGANRLNMTAAGNIGIGNTVPGSRFQVDNAGTNPTTTINQTNAANINIALGAFNSNVSNVNYGNSTILGQRGTGSLANTFLYVGIPTAITGIAATPFGFGVQGTSETGTGIAALTNSGVAFRAFANLAAAYAIQTIGRVQISGQGAGLNKVLTSDAIGNATWQTLGGGVGVGGSGTLNFVSKWTPDGFNLGNSQIFDNGTNVGVNTVAATYKFQVNHGGSNGIASKSTAGYSIIDIDAANGDAAMRFFNNGVADWHVGNGPGVSVNGFDIRDMKTATTRMVIMNVTGNVGLSNTNPQARLHVTSDNAISYAVPTALATTSGAVVEQNIVTDDEVAGITTYSNGSTLENEGILAAAGGSSDFNIGGIFLSQDASSGTNVGVFGRAQNGAFNLAGYFIGSVRILDGTQGFGKIFTSDGAGTGSWQTAAAAGIVSGSGTLNFVPKWTPNGTTLGNSQAFDNGQTYSIGSATPTTDKFYVNDASFNTWVNVNQVGSNVGGFSFTRANLYKYDFEIDASNNLLLRNYTAGGNIPFFINAVNSNIGINTVTPSAAAKMQVDGAGTGGNPFGIMVTARTGSVSPNIDAVYGDGSFRGIYGTNLSTVVRGRSIGVEGVAGGTNYGIEAIGVYASATGTGLAGTNNYGLYAQASGAAGSNYAAWLNGQVRISDGTEGAGKVLTSDASGNASWQTAVAFKISAFNAPVNAPLFTFVPITQWANVEYEIGSVGNYTPGTGQYTVPVTGTYHVDASVDWAQPAANGSGYGGISVFVNGGQYAVHHNTIITLSVASGNGISTDVKLNAGDKVSISVFHNTSGSLSLINSGADENFSIHLVK